MKLPLISTDDKPFYPQKENICPICRTDRSALNSNFLVINGGALKKNNNKSYVPSDDLIGFLSLSYHLGTSEPITHSATIDIVAGARNGQFELYFCSIDCLRTFFNKLINELEIKLNNK